MSGCCDRAIGALLCGADDAGGDPLREAIYHQRLTRLRRELWRFRRDQQPKPVGLFKFSTFKWRKAS